MKPLWQRFLSASLLAPTLAVGCRHVETSSGCATCHGRSPVASVVAAPAATLDAGGYNVVRGHPVLAIPAPEPVVSAPPAVPAPMPVVTAPATIEDEPTPSRMPEPKRMPSSGDSAVVHNTGPLDRPQTSVSMKVVDLPTTVIGGDAKPVPAAIPVPAPGSSVSAPHPLGYAHALDYSMLVGELNYNPRQGTWRLRYATVDDEDRYGGSVTLVGADPLLRDCKAGQVVRVHGSLTDPDAHVPSPAYRVSEVEVVGPAH